MKLSRTTCLLSIGAAAVFLGMAVGAAWTGPSEELPFHAWISTAQDPDALAQALAAFDHKLVAGFVDRMDHAMADGTLRVMGTLSTRDDQTEASIRGSAQAFQWYGSSSRFMAKVLPDQVPHLLALPTLVYLEADHPLDYFLSESTVDVHARAGASNEGVWRFDPTGGPRGALASAIPGLDRAVTGASVTISIIDSGIDHTHRDFGGWDCEPAPYEPCDSRILESITTEMIVEPALLDGDDLPTTEAASGHGTHVAGIALGNGFYIRDGDVDDRYGGDNLVIGVAPEAKLVSVKNGDTIWAGLSSFALQWQVDHAAEYGIRVSSNSWGCLTGCAFAPNGLVNQLMGDLYNAGVVVLVAAGNGGGTGGGAEFAGDSQSPYAFSIANYDDATDRMNSGSSRGSQSTSNFLDDPATWSPAVEGANGRRRPDIGAPGTDIWAAASLTGGAAAGIPRVATNDVTGGVNGCCFVPYRLMGGTSMATPHVAGATALLFDLCPQASNLDVMRALLVGADRTRILKTTGAQPAEAFEVGYGGLNVVASAQWLLKLPACAGIIETDGTLTVTSPTEGARIDAGMTTIQGTVDRLGSAPDLPPTVGLSAPTTSGPPPLLVEFQLSAMDDRRVASWLFESGDGATEEGSGAPPATISHTYGTLGSFTARLAATDIAGQVAEVLLTILVQEETSAPILWFVGDGSITAVTDEDLVTNFGLSSAGPGGLHTEYTTSGSWNMDADENAFVPTFVGAEAVQLSGELVTIVAYVDYLQPLNLLGDVCPLGAQLFDAAGFPLGPVGGVTGFVGPGFGVPMEIRFTITPPAGLVAGLKAQMGTIGADCGSTAATWVWGTEDFPGRLELAAGDRLVPAAGFDGQAMMAGAFAVSDAGTERVEVLVDGAVAASIPVDTTSQGSYDDWTLDVDLTGRDAVTALLVQWVDADGTILDQSPIVVDILPPGLDATASLTPKTCRTDLLKFVLNGLDRNAAAPSRIHLTWSDGAEEDIPLSQVNGRTAHYDTATRPDAVVTEALVRVPSDWTGSFHLAEGPC